MAMNYTAARETMVDTQIRPNDVSDPDIVSAFLRTPREVFVPGSAKSVAYSELEIETSDERALWTPMDTALMVAAVNVAPTDIVLVIGAGAGYETALLSQLAETVIALEDNAALVDTMTERFAELGLSSAVAVEGKLKAGLADQGPFDIIYVCGRVETVPAAWTEQLADGGRLAVVHETEQGLGLAEIHTKAGDVVSSRVAFETLVPKFKAFNRKAAFVF